MSLTIYLSYRRAVSKIATITHNLNNMAGEANAYTLIWHPGQAGISKARQMIKPLSKVLALVKAEPERFKRHNPENAWGCYEDFIRFIETYLDACKASPGSTIIASN